MNGTAVLDAPGKVLLLAEYLDAWGLRTLVETGLYLGGGSGFGVLDRLERYVVIDAQMDNCRDASRHLADLGAWTPLWGVHCGDSARVLPAQLPLLDGPALFWLDAHAISADEGLPGFPLVRELEAVASWEHGPRSVVLVDDLRMMDGGLDGSPGLDWIRGYADSCELWDRAERDDVMRLTPRGGG